MSEQHGSKTEGRGDDLARQERMAELKREIAAIDAEHWTVDNTDEKFQRRERLRSELSRLRNEGGGEEERCGYCGKGGTCAVEGPECPYADTDMHEPASPSDLPAREAIERADEAMRQVWTEWFTFYENHFRARNIAISAADQQAFYEIAQPILRKLAALQPLSQGVGAAIGQSATTHRDMAYFVASEAASYYYPGEDQQLLRDAYCRGAAEYAPKPSDAPISDWPGEENEWERSAQSVASPSQPEGVREALEYATHLAEALAAKHYADVPQWKALPDLLGVLSQIDNMTTGLTRALPHDARPPYEIADVEDGKFYVVRAGTDHVVAEFDDKPAVEWQPLEIAKVIEGPHKPVPAESEYDLAELRNIRWRMLSCSEQNSRLNEAKAVIEHFRTLSTKPANAADREGDRDA